MPYRPQLKISNVTNLQDARYSAAVGFNYVSFSLERGHPHKLSPSMIWNMVQWLEGPEIILEIDAGNWEEVQQVGTAPENFWVSFPAAHWTGIAPISLKGIILRSEHQLEIPQIQEWVAQSEIPLKVEMLISHPDQLAVFSSVYPYIFVNFPELEITKNFIRSSEHAIFGLSFQSEAEEKPGLLDYDELDACLELMGLEL